MEKLNAIFVVLVFLAPSYALGAIHCPDMPSAVTTVSHDVRTDINATVGKLGNLKAGEVGIKAEVAAKNLFDKYPNVDRLLTMQTMSSTYCSMLDSANISDSEKLNRWEAFQSKILGLEDTKPEKSSSRNSEKPNSRVTDVPLEKIVGKSTSVGEVEFTLNSVQRSGSDVIAYFTVSNNGQNATQLSLFGKGSRYGYGGSTLAAGGREYLAQSIDVSGQESVEFIGRRYDPNAPIKGTVRFNNIPSDVQSIDLLRIAYSANNLKPRGAFEYRSFSID